MAYADMSGNMPRLTKKYPILGAVTECDFRGKNQSTKTLVQIALCFALDFFSENALGDGPAFWIFPSIHG